MQDTTEIPRNEGEEFESILVEKAVQAEVFKLSTEIFSKYITDPQTNLTLLGVDPYSNIFLSDVLKNLEELYSKKYPNMNFSNSNIRSHYLYSSREKPEIKDRDVLLVEVYLHEENNQKIREMRDELKNESPRSIEVCTFISTLPDEEFEKLDVKYNGFLFPDIEIAGYGIGEPGPEIGDRIIYAKEKE